MIYSKEELSDLVYGTITDKNLKKALIDYSMHFNHPFPINLIDEITVGKLREAIDNDEEIDDIENPKYDY